MGHFPTCRLYHFKRPCAIFNMNTGETEHMHMDISFLFYPLLLCNASPVFNSRPNYPENALLTEEGYL